VACPPVSGEAEHVHDGHVCLAHVRIWEAQVREVEINDAAQLALQRMFPYASARHPAARVGTNEQNRIHEKQSHMKSGKFPRIYYNSVTHKITCFDVEKKLG